MLINLFLISECFKVYFSAKSWFLKYKSGDMILDVKTLDDDVPAYLVNVWHFNLINPYFNKHNFRQVYRKHVHNKIQT